MADKRATEEKLGDLHGLLADEFANQIESGKASPALLNTARQFLKDNGIEVAPGSDSKLGDLAGKLGELDGKDFENVHVLQTRL